ncbi:hypothetical protein BH24ACT22_BH24ACT22_19350 [soil metagenome]
MKQRLLREEDGFTLPEALVAMLMMVTVMFALYAIFDMSLRVFSFGNDKVEAVENARIGLSRMEREIRAAYPYNKPGEDNIRLSTREPDRISFGNDVGPIDRKIDEGEEISYYSNDKKLLRRKGSLSRTVVAPVPKEGLKFEYLEADGVTVAENESDTAIVSITLKIEVDGRSQTLSTNVALRNEGDA